MVRITLNKPMPEIPEITPLLITLTSTGTGAGVSTFVVEVSEDQAFTIESGTAKFYTNSAGTLGESTVWNVTAGALRTIYIKVPSGTSTLKVANKDTFVKIGKLQSENFLYIKAQGKVIFPKYISCVYRSHIDNIAAYSLR